MKEDRDGAVEPAHLRRQPHDDHVAQSHHEEIDGADDPEPALYSMRLHIEAPILARAVHVNDRHPHQ